MTYSRLLTDDGVTTMAKAMMRAADDFSDPVTLYVKGEYRNRWCEANPGKEFDDEHDIFGSEDNDFEELESWKILARAAMGSLAGLIS